ncbi:MAG: hypothetical protein JSR26_00790 [Proteobacteria bacterium]|nr:hypothetical protein [Pseudomonadota bacterium]
MRDDRKDARVRGWIALSGTAGKALRMHGTLPACGDVLNGSGTFRAGDRVFVTMRGTDGGQAVVARAISAVDAQALPCPPRHAPTAIPAHPALREEGLEVLWLQAFRPAASSPDR